MFLIRLSITYHKSCNTHNMCIVSVETHRIMHLTTVHVPTTRLRTKANIGDWICILCIGTHYRLTTCYMTIHFVCAILEQLQIFNNITIDYLNEMLFDPFQINACDLST
jgi:hypothetical protein